MIQYCWEDINYLQSVSGCYQLYGEATITYLGRLVRLIDIEITDTQFYSMPIKVQWFLNRSILNILRGH